MDPRSQAGIRQAEAEYLELLNEVEELRKKLKQAEEVLKQHADKCTNSWCHARESAQRRLL